MVNIAVIGTGVMGTNHVRVLSELEGVNLAAISDIDEEKLKLLSSKYNIKNTYKNHDEMLKNEKLDGVVVAVQAEFHKKVVLDCIKAGVNILVEKPIAHSLEDAQEMIDKAKEKGVMLTVGHIERFNPVVTKIKEFIDNGMLGKIYLINSIRAGPVPKRLWGLHEGVIVDLSVHDVDIINYLVGDIEQVYSQLILSGKQEIYAKNLFEIKDGIMGCSEFSWVSPKRARTIEILGTKGALKGDYFNQELTFYENSDESETALTKGTIGAGNVTNHTIDKQEPLKLELKHFTDCIKNNKKPLVDPKDAKKSLGIALAILESGKSNKPVNI